MIGYESPSITTSFLVRYQITKSAQKIIPVSITQKYLTTSDPPPNHVMKGTGSIYPGFSRHVDIRQNARIALTHVRPLSTFEKRV